jgi:heterotetrameric sarcosine oxidase delta subunit
MRITCPHCGERDRREFTYQGAAKILNRPSPDAGNDAWADYVHLRDNPAGETRDMWYHDPCGAWLVVHRNSVTHEVYGSQLAAEVAR